MEGSSEIKVSNLNNTEPHQDTPPGTLIARCLKQLRNYIFCGIFIAFFDIVKGFFVKLPKVNIEKMEKRSGQTVVMTGGPRGIGFDIVKKLCQLDYNIILGVRNIPASEKGIAEIRKLGITSGHVKFFHLDLKSLGSVRRFASEVLTSTEGSRIDVLLNNAGIMNVPYEKTEDNFESHFQVNYLSHFLLTNLLLPRMKETSREHGPRKIINTSSSAQRAGSIDFEELEISKVYSGLKCYADSKLCQVIHARTLETMFRNEGTNVHAYSIHPGEVPTELWEGLGYLINASRPIVKYFLRTTDAAANVVLYPVLNPDVEHNSGGEFFQNCAVKSPNSQAMRSHIQKMLWERSLEIIENEMN